MTSGSASVSSLGAGLVNFVIGSVTPDGLPQSWYILVNAMTYDTPSQAYMGWSMLSEYDPVAKEDLVDYTYPGAFSTLFASESGGTGTWTSSPDGTSVPIPPTVLLLGSGLLGLAAYRRRELSRS